MNVATQSMLGRRALGALAMALALAGCGDSEPAIGAGAATGSGTDASSTNADGTGTGAASGDGTTNWWGTSAGATFPADSGGPPGAEEGEDEGGDESFSEIFGEGTIEPGVSYDGIVEVIVVSNGQEQCILTFSAADVTWLDTCAECEFAFSYTLADLEEHVTEGCAAAGVDAQMLLGSTQTAGLAGEELYREIDGVWRPSGEGVHEMAESLFVYGYPLE